MLGGDLRRKLAEAGIRKSTRKEEIIAKQKEIITKQKKMASL